ncbi:MAG: hypothetical protein MJA82_21010 [Clostridia bacterium]|nr:hypothetical protein [Clostridia bacterium]
MCKNNYKNITKLINSRYCALSIWESRYGSGFYASVLRLNYADTLQDILTGNDIEAVELECYLGDKGEWLPVCRGESLNDVMSKLNLKLEEWADKDGWYEKVE